jgi:antirestriction protein ArdC
MNKVYEIIQNIVLNTIDAKGLLPWHQEWDSAYNLPRNGFSGHVYRGVNIWLTLAAGFSSPLWYTRKQILEIRKKFPKASIKYDDYKNSGTIIIYWNWIPKKEDGVVIGKIPMLRYYKVWNFQQCENMPEPQEMKRFTEIESAEDVLQKTPVKPVVNHGGPKAYYTPALDRIQMPARESFETSAAYYRTLFHEMAHATGHETRLNRDMSGSFGSGDYSKEELIAEMTSCFLCGAYLKGWRNKIAKDPTLVVSAGSAAQKAADCILGVKFD